MRRTKRRFTLIEMMLVVAVLAILLGMGTSLLVMTASGGAIKQGTVTLGSMLTATRAKAQGLRTYVALVFPIANGAPDDIRNRSMIMCEVEPDRRSPESRYGRYLFKNSIPGQGWQVLPRSTSILLGPMYEERLSEHIDEVKKIEPTDFKVLASGAISTRKGLFGGFFQTGVNDDMKLFYLDIATGEKYFIPDGSPCIVFRPGGQMDMMTYLIENDLFVTDLSIVGGQIKRKDNAQYRRVSLNPLTGKVRYEY